MQEIELKKEINNPDPVPGTRGQLTTAI